jgi:hypothetical protein
MTRDEQRQAWRTYAAAALSTFRNAEYTNGDIESVEDVADRLLKAELQRFDSPDHSGEATTKVEPPAWVSAQFRPLDLSVTAPFVNTGQSPEPRPWVGLSAAERLTLLDGFFRQARVTLDDLLIRHDQMLREKNGGTR